MVVPSIELSSSELLRQKNQNIKQNIFSFSIKNFVGKYNAKKCTSLWGVKNVNFQILLLFKMPKSLKFNLFFNFFDVAMKRRSGVGELRRRSEIHDQNSLQKIIVATMRKIRFLFLAPR